MDMVQLIHYTENSVLFFQYVYSNGALLVTSPAGKVAKYCDEYVVCVSVCPRGYLRNHTRDLYQIFVHVAYVRGSVIIRQVDDRPHHRSAEEGDGSAKNGRSVIYDRIVVSVLNVGEVSLFHNTRS